MFRNRISRFYKDWDADKRREPTIPAGFTLVSLRELPAGAQQMAHYQQALYQLAYVRAQVASVDPDWFYC